MNMEKRKKSSLIILIILSSIFQAVKPILKMIISQKSNNKCQHSVKYKKNSSRLKLSKYPIKKYQKLNFQYKETQIFRVYQDKT